MDEKSRFSFDGKLLSFDAGNSPSVSNEEAQILAIMDLSALLDDMRNRLAGIEAIIARK